MRRLWLASLLWSIAALPAEASAASWFDRVRCKLGLAGPPAVATLDRVVAHLTTLPDEASRSVLAGEAGPHGHWRFANRAGETFSATPGEVSRAPANLLPPLTPTSPPLTIYVTEASVFEHAAAFAALPSGARLRVMIGTTDYALFREGHRLFAEVTPKVLLALSTQADFDEARSQLDHPWSPQPVRLLALEPGAMEPLGARAPAATTSTGRPIERADPDRLRNALPLLSGQHVVLVGRIDGERFTYQPSSGPERSILLADVVTAAGKADVDLAILSSASARQPGTRNWLWLKADVAGLEAGLNRSSPGPFLALLAGEGNRVLVSVMRHGEDRVTLSARVVPIEAGRGGGLGVPLAGAVSDLIANITGTSTSTRVDLHLMSEARRNERALRLLPGVPALVQFVYGALLALALPGLGVAGRWWQRLWPLEERRDYGTAWAWWAARITRRLLFAVLFLPVVGWFAGLCRMVWAFRGPRPENAAERSAAL